MVLSSPLPRTTSAVEDAFCPAVQNPDAGTRTPAHPTTVGPERVEAARRLPGGFDTFRATTRPAADAVQELRASLRRRSRTASRSSFSMRAVAVRSG